MTARMSDHEKLCAAISIVQQHIMALDSPTFPQQMWGTMHMPACSLELAVSLMCDAVEALEYTNLEVAA